MNQEDRRSTKHAATGKKAPRMHGASKGSGTTNQTLSYRGKADPRYSGAVGSGGSTKQTGTIKGTKETKQMGVYRRGGTSYSGALD